MTALSVRAQAPCRAQFERMRGGISVSGSTRSNRRVPARGRSSTACVPRAVSIYDAVRKSSYDDRDGSDGFGAADGAPNAPPASTGSNVSTRAQTPPRKSKPGPAIVPPAVISSKAAMLAAAEDLASADCDIDDDECAKRAINDDASADEQDGIVKWSIKALDKNLDDLERTKPRQAEVAWKVVTRGGEGGAVPGVPEGRQGDGGRGHGGHQGGGAGGWQSRGRGW